jgi:hypothetical protein
VGNMNFSFRPMEKPKKKKKTTWIEEIPSGKFS